MLKTMHIKEDLFGIHERLDQRFREMKAARKHLPVFILEHSLDAGTLVRVRRLLSALLSSGLPKAVADAPLPLLVVATEAGYRYRGTGTDFWPVLEQELSATLHPDARYYLTQAFAAEAERLGLARPGKTRWERHFLHIAWPIANAIAPIELHRHIAVALRQATRNGVTALEKEPFETALQAIARDLGSSRLIEWLEGHSAATAVCAHLLSGQETQSWLSAEVLARVSSDVMSDYVARRALHEAQRAAKHIGRRVVPPPPAQFRIVFEDNDPKDLELAGPVLPMDRRQDVMAELGIPNDTLRATGAVDEIDLHAFLAGGVIEIGKFRRLPAELLVRGDGRSPDGPAKGLLAALQPDDEPVFRFDPQKGAAFALPSKACENPADRYFMIENRAGRDNSGNPGLRWLNPAHSGDAHVLARKGISFLEEIPAPVFLGMPLSGDNRAFASNFPLLFPLANGDDAPIRINDQQAHGPRVQTGQRSVELLFPGPGNHTVEIQKEGRLHARDVVVAERADLPPAEIRTDPSDPSLEDLAAGNFSVLASAPLPLENITLRFEFGDDPIKTVIDRLPMRLSGGSPRLAGLRRRYSEALHVGGRVPSLRLAAPGLRGLYLTPRRLPRRLVPDQTRMCWHCDDHAGPGEVTDTLTATPDAPLLVPLSGPWSSEGFGIVVPDSGRDDDLLSGIGLGQPDRLRATAARGSPVSMPLVREANSRTDGIGLIDVARSLVAWRSVRLDNPLADFERREALRCVERMAVEQLCGKTWVLLECRVDLSVLSERTAFFSEAKRNGLLSGEGLFEVKGPKNRSDLEGRLRWHLAKAVPDLVATSWEDEYAEKLDYAVMDAYEELRDLLSEQGAPVPEEPDLYRPPEKWHRAICSAVTLPRLELFKALILPQGRWQALSERSYRSFSEDDVVDLLDACHLDARRRSGLRWIERSDLRVLLRLWIDPLSVIDDENWAERLAKALSDGQTARAVRYSALRLRAVRHDLPEQEAF